MNSETIVKAHLVDHLPKLRRIVSRIAKDQGVVDDFTQECCVRIISKEKLWSGDKNTLSQWMNTITRNLLKKELPKQKKEQLQKQELIEESISPTKDNKFSEEQIKWVLSQFAQLTEKQKQILGMKYYKGMTMISIGKELGITNQAVSQNIAKAISKLRGKARAQGLLNLLLPWRWNYRMISDIVVLNRTTEVVSILLILGGIGLGSHMMLSKNNANVLVSEKAKKTTDKKKEITVKELLNELYQDNKIANELIKKELVKKGNVAIPGIEKSISEIYKYQHKLLDVLEVLYRNKEITNNSKSAIEKMAKLNLKINERSNTILKTISETQRQKEIEKEEAQNEEKYEIAKKWLENLDQARFDEWYNYGELSLEGLNVSDSDINHLKLLSMRSLNLKGTKITNKGLNQLANDWLEIGGGPTKLELGNGKITYVGLKHLAGLSLTHLELGENFTDQGLQYLNWHNLSSLSLRNSKVTDKGLRYLKDWNNLSSLNLHNIQITDKGLQHLKDLHITELDLGNTKVTDKGVKYLKGMPLESLNLESTLISDNGIEALNNMATLMTLSLSYTNITDRGLNKLNLANIVSLDLTATEITDDGLKNLKNLKNLSLLDLTSTNVTELGKKKIMKELSQLLQIGEIVR